MSEEPFRWTRRRIALSIVQWALLLPLVYAIGRGRQYDHLAAMGLAVSVGVAVAGFALLFVLGVRAFGYDFGPNRDRPRMVAAIALQATIIVAALTATLVILNGPD
jgi:hypothetical protein